MNRWRWKCSQLHIELRDTQVGNFDPQRLVKQLNDSCGIALSLSKDFEKSRSVNGLGPSAFYIYCDAVAATIVGMDEAVLPLLTKAEQWLQVAMDTNEVPDRSTDVWENHDRLLTLSCIRWLRDGYHDQTNLKRAVDFLELHFTRPETKDTVELGLSMHLLADCDDWDRVLRWFAENPKLHPPRSPTYVQTEAHMAYVMARQRAGLDYSETDVETAKQKFLKRHMDGWLSRGHYARAADWLKILHWQQGSAGLTPREAILKCYDYLPGCQPPQAIRL